MRDLLSKAVLLLADKGFSGTSFQEIADAVGLSRPSLYHYFDSKKSVLEALVKDVTISAANVIHDVIQHEDWNATRKLDQAVSGLVRWAIDRTAHFRVMERSESELPEDLLRAHHAAKLRVLNGMKEIILEGVSSGEFRPVDERTTALAIIGMCNWVAYWYSPNLESDKDNIVKTISELARNAVIDSSQRQQRPTGMLGALDVLREDIDYLERQIKGN